MPADAISASEVLVEPTDDEVAAVAPLETNGSIVVQASFELCTLDCARAVPMTALFVIPSGGVNSQGEWNDEAVPDVTVERVAA